jgi:FHS family L-fucose permease-like MFS transporter
MRSSGVSPAFISVTALFFAWGFISSNNDPLIAALIVSFDLTYTEALLIQIVSFIAFGLVSLPAAALLARVDAPRAIAIALFTMMCGCLLVAVVAGTHRYELILAALFLLAAGITTLQVAANPLAAALGVPEQSHFRLTLAQAFNSLGVVVGVSFGSAIMLSEEVLNAGHTEALGPAQRTEVLWGVSRAFGWMGVSLGVLLVFAWVTMRQLGGRLIAAGDSGDASPFAALQSPWAVAGAAAIGLYVGAEVSIASIMINFLHQTDILDVPFEAAGFYLANVYWMGALIGRFAGSYLLMRTEAPPLLAGAAVAAAGLCLLVVVQKGPVAAYAALAVGLCNSIMFPTIFSITLERSRAPNAATSGLLCLAIAGGALLPLAVGAIADAIDLSTAFAVPLLAYAAIAVFAAAATRLRRPAI